MKRIYPDRQNCIGCGLCEVACIEARSRLGDLVAAFRYECSQEGLIPRRRVLHCGSESASLGCMHCENAPCIASCPSGSLFRNIHSGRVVYDVDRCIGCWVCLGACSLGVIERHPLKKQIVQCDLCTEKGSGPACVEACPNSALIFEER